MQAGRALYVMVPVKMVIEAVVTNNVGYNFKTRRLFPENENGITEEGIRPDANLMGHLEILERRYIFRDNFNKRLPLFKKYEATTVALK